MTDTELTILVNCINRLDGQIAVMNDKKIIWEIVAPWQGQWIKILLHKDRPLQDVIDGIRIGKRFYNDLFSIFKREYEQGKIGAVRCMRINRIHGKMIEEAASLSDEVVYHKTKDEYLIYFKLEDRPFRLMIPINSPGFYKTFLAYGEVIDKAEILSEILQQEVKEYDRTRNELA